MPRYPILAAALLASAAQAAPAPDPKGEAQLAKILGDRVAGAPRACILQVDIVSSQNVTGTAIVYRSRQSGQYYVNRPQIGADLIRRDDILATATTIGQLCRLDTVNLIDRTGRFPHGFVTLGDFVPYRRPR